MDAVSIYYLDGIKEGRAMFRKHGATIATETLDNLNRTIEGFRADSPVGQLLRGERDFWKNQIARTTTTKE